MRATSAVHPVPSMEQEGSLGAQSEVECRLGFEGRDQGWRGDEHQLDVSFALDDAGAVGTAVPAAPEAPAKDSLAGRLDALKR